jgi:hypothetical protein
MGKGTRCKKVGLKSQGAHNWSSKGHWLRGSHSGFKILGVTPFTLWGTPLHILSKKGGVEKNWNQKEF